MNNDFKDVLVFIVIILVVVFVVVVGVVSWDKSLVRRSCESFGQITNRETKYVEYTYWNYTCVTPTGDGKWINTSALREVVD